MEFDIEAGNEGERLSIALALSRVVKEWHPESTGVHILRNISIKPAFGFVNVDIGVQGASQVYGGAVTVEDMLKKKPKVHMVISEDGHVSKWEDPLWDSTSPETFEAVEDVRVLEGYAIDPLRAVIIGSHEQRQDVIRYFDLSSRPFITEGSIIYNFDFQSWETVMVTDPVRHLRHIFEPLLSDQSVQSSKLEEYTPEDALKNEHGVKLSLVREYREGFMEEILEAAEQGAPWRRDGIATQNDSVIREEYRFRTDSSRFNDLVKDYGRAFRAWRRARKN